MRIESTLASIAAAKGTRSRSLNVVIDAAYTRPPRCVSALVSPWPGKCFTQTLTPPARNPSTAAIT